MSIKLSTRFIISAIKANDKRVYLAIDTHSSGYGYWTEWVQSAQTYESLDKLYTISPTDYLYKEVVSIQILKVEQIAEILSNEDVASVAKIKAMNEIAEIQRKLEEKLTELRSMS